MWTEAINRVGEQTPVRFLAREQQALRRFWKKL